jgi:hypothetical protein
LAALSARPQPRDALLEVMRELVAEVKGLRADLAARRGPTPDAQDEELLRVIAEHVEHRVFSAAELVAHAALESAVQLREVLRGRNARKLGRVLMRLEGRALNGLVLYRNGEDRNGLVWRVSRVSKPQNSWTSALG